MNKSETIGKLSEALSKAQSVMEGAKKDSSNPFFKSTYADLASVWDAIRKPLTDNGLAILQVGVFIPEHPDLVAIETTLTHISGEWVSGIMTAKPAKNDSQSVGSCVTYLRRYGASAMIGGYGEDDDGNVASGKGIEQKTEAKPKPLLSPKPNVISEAQVKRMFALAHEHGVTTDALKEYVYVNCKVEHTKDMSVSSYEQVCKFIEGHKKAA